MSFSGGTFSINSSGQPVVTGTVISSTAFNALTADLATGLSTCILKDGTQNLTANIPMGGFKLTGLAAGASNGDSVRYEQVVGAFLPISGGTLTGNLLFTDNLYDIGASGATRPRNLFLSGTAAIAGTATFTLKPIISSLTASTGLLADSSKGIVSAAAPITNSLAGDVALNNTSNYFTGPSCAQGTTGTWWADGTVTLQDTAGGGRFEAKLWDGTTVIASAKSTSVGINEYITISLSGFLASPAGNIRISVKDPTSTSGVIIFNVTGTSKDSTLSVFQIA